MEMMDDMMSLAYLDFGWRAYDTQHFLAISYLLMPLLHLSTV